MPQMGVSVAEGTIVAWRLDLGGRIEAEQTICEISTDKIDTEVPAPVSGVVAEILVAVEETVEVGTVLARIAPEDGSGGAPVAPTPDSSLAPTPDSPAETGPAPEAAAAEPAVAEPAAS